MPGVTPVRTLAVTRGWDRSKPPIATGNYRPKAASNERCIRPSAVLHNVRLQLMGIGEFRNACISAMLSRPAGYRKNLFAANGTRGRFTAIR